MKGTPRVAVEFQMMLQNYKKEGLQSTYKELFFIIDELDKIAQAFEFLNNLNETADLEKALTLLRELKIIPNIRLSKDKTND